MCGKQYKKFKMEVMKKTFITLLLVFFSVGFSAHASIGTPNKQVTKSYIVINHNTGKILDSYNANMPQYPASLTKVMTLYILFDEIKAKRVNLKDKFTVSKLASSQVPSKIGLKPGDTITVEKAIDAMIIRSANDVAVAVAENIAGSVDEFANMMNKKAKELGLNSTRFLNPSGLPNRMQVTTAKDMVILSKRIIDDHGSFYHYFSRKSANIKGKTIRSHNNLLGTYGIDGLKTGYISASGFHIAISSETSGVRLTAVYMGYNSSNERNQTAKDIIASNFQEAIYSKLENNVKDTSFYTPEFLAQKESSEKIKTNVAKVKPNVKLETDFHAIETKVLANNKNTIQKETKEQEEPIKKAAISKPQSAPASNSPSQQRVSSEEVMKDMIQVTAKVPAPKEEQDIEISRIEQGKYYIQLGAFSSQDTAKTIIFQAKKLVGIVRQNKSLIERVTLADGRQLYRAIINTKDQAEAKQACGVIRNSGNECLVKARILSVEI